MSELFQTILLRVTLAGIASAAALHIVGNGALREVVRLAAGLLLLLALLQPLSGLRLPAWADWEADVPDAEAIGAQNAQTTMTTIAATIAHTLEQRAQAEGFDCTVHIAMGNDEDGILQIDRVTVYYSAADAARLEELQTLVTEECGVPAERQELIEQ